MMKIAFLILAHNYPEFLSTTIEKLLSAGHYVCVHYDKSSPREEKEFLSEAFKNTESFCLLSEVECRWGEWSLVQAPLLALEKIQSLGWDIEYVHFMSGLEVPIKPLSELGAFLKNNNYDFIESVDIKKEKWVKGGPEIERFLYEFPYNFITHREQFDSQLNKQKRSKKLRSLPENLDPHLGSQWWTLRWSTCKKILSHLADSSIIDYFKLTWIPDESFFQSIIRCIVPAEEIISTQLLYHHLIQSNGRPLIFMNGHESIIQNSPHFFIRKVSPQAEKLLETIKNIVEGGVTYQAASTVQNLMDYKIAQDAIFYNSSIVSEDAPWSKLHIESKKYNVTEIIMLTHSQKINTVEIEQRFAKYDDILYVGRPYKKVEEFLPHRIYEKILKRYCPNMPEALPVDCINKIVFHAPHIKYIIFSYVPRYDWIFDYHFNFCSTTYSFLLQEEGKGTSNLELSVLRSSLVYERLEEIKSAAAISLEELEIELCQCKNKSQ